MKNEIEEMKKQFDTLASILLNLKEKAQLVMPLVSDSIDLTIKIVNVYKEAYVTGLEDNGTKKGSKKDK